MKKKYDDKNEHRSKLYSVWCSMRERCRNENNKDYKHYGGRGIAVCGDWDECKNFKEWAISNGYKEGLSIDRIDTNGDYCPGNCRWITIQEQQRNKRNSRFLTFNGETHCLSQWAKITGLKRETIRDRIDKSGWSVEEALSTPLVTNDITRQQRYKSGSRKSATAEVYMEG